VLNIPMIAIWRIYSSMRSGAMSAKIADNVNGPLGGCLAFSSSVPDLEPCPARQGFATPLRASDEHAQTPLWHLWEGRARPLGA
jgi:hypothetical protein